MKILIAPDSFKGSMSAYQAASCIEEGLSAVLQNAKIEKMAIADGGDGTMEALVKSTSGVVIAEKVHDPLGEIINAHYGILGNGKTAVIEMACASGLVLVPAGKRDPMMTTTYGTGELITHALDRGIRHIILGVGGSATVDGGVGMAQALGISFRDKDGHECARGARELGLIENVDTIRLHPALRECHFEIACDVSNPLTGNNGAARVYGPQKGASPEIVTVLEQSLEKYVAALERCCGKKLAHVPGTGAGGGIIVPLLAFAQTEIKRGVDLVLQACDFNTRLDGCDLIITGEGRLDRQTEAGKAPVGLAQMAKARGIPVVALCGSVGPNAEVVNNKGITAFFSALQSPVREEQLAEKGPEMLRVCARQLGRLLQTFFEIN